MDVSVEISGLLDILTETANNERNAKPGLVTRHAPDVTNQEKAKHNTCYDRCW